MPISPMIARGGVALALLFGTVLPAMAPKVPRHGAPQGLIDAPELGRPGQWPVGTVLEHYRFPDRLHIIPASLTTGKLAREDRDLAVRLWYPATAKGATPVRYSHRRARAGAAPFSVVFDGMAYTAATPAKGQVFPLVLISHGYGGWDTAMSNLAETIASHGYVVAAIDHADELGPDPAAQAIGFGNVLINRANDQRLVLERLLDRQAKRPARFAGLIDGDHVAIIGYSMGGYGALATIGAAADPASPIFARLPAEARAQIFAADAVTAARVKALIAIAPWGNQPENRVYSPASIARIATPMLIIDGDHDDVVDFHDGVSWLFDRLTAADRYLLVYRDARHNVANNALPAAAFPDFQAAEFLSEPVWRQDRINAINGHFITAFLDVTLKGMKDSARYLDVPSVLANDGTWPTPPNAQNLGGYAGDGEPRYWRGFQRRWALGLELRHGNRQ